MRPRFRGHPSRRGLRPLLRMRVAYKPIRNGRTATMPSPEPKTVHDGGRYFEGPRWHAGRLWFVDCMERTLLSLAPSGECERHAKFDDDTPCGLGVLPDGRIIVLTMFRKRLMTYADGRL